MVTTTSARSTEASCSGFGELPGQVDADLGHGRDHGRVEGVVGVGPGRAHLDSALGVVVEQGGGHLAAPGVVDTDEQDLGRVLHGGSSASAAPARRARY
jgi:hypothetical protein